MGHFPLLKNQSVTLEKSQFVWGKIKFSALQAHFRYTKTPFSENFQSVTPGRGVGQGLKSGMVTIRDYVAGISKTGSMPHGGNVVSLRISFVWQS